MFVNREEELNFLESEAKRSSYSFVVVYGRRRVGKTELIKKFIKNKNHIYFLVSQEPTNIQLTRLIARVADYLKERTPKIDDWLEGINYMGEKLKESKIVLIIDEFPYMVESNKAVPSYFQYMVDEHLKNSKSMLILSGSSIGLMESKVLGHKSPLYGRRTGQIDLEPFDFQKLRLIIKKDIKECIEAYAIFGNIPMYLSFFDNKKNLADNILINILSKNAFLHKEPELILKQEFREPAKYMSIISAIAKGHTQLSSISGATKISPGTLSKYIEKLIKTRLIKREIAVTQRGKKSKKSLYIVNDGLFNFWFKFVESNLSDVETNPKQFLTSTIVPGLPSFISKTFEDVCREFVRKKLNYGSVGRWWHKEEEIDVVGIDKQENKILFAECKWQEKVNAKKILEELKQKSQYVDWHNEKRKEYYAIFAKSFTKKIKEPNLMLFDLKDLERLILIH